MHAYLKPNTAERPVGAVAQLFRALLLSCCAVFSVATAQASELGTGIKRGDVAPLFQLPDLRWDKQFRLEKLRGKVVYLDFWASWCGPCRVSMPAMEALHKAYYAEGFRVVAVNMDEDRDAALEFLREFKLNYYVLGGTMPQREQLAQRYGVMGLPTAYLIDRQGQVSAVHQGFRPGDKSRIRQQVLSLLRPSAAL